MPGYADQLLIWLKEEGWKYPVVTLKKVGDKWAVVGYDHEDESNEDS